MMKLSEDQFEIYVEEFKKPWGAMLGMSILYFHLIAGGMDKITDKAGDSEDRVLKEHHDKGVTLQFPYFAAAFREAVTAYYRVYNPITKKILFDWIKNTVEESIILKDLAKEDRVAWLTIIRKKDYKEYLRQLKIQ